MLVSLPALLAAKLWAIALASTFLDQGLSVACSSNASFLEGRIGVIPRCVIELVVDRILLQVAHACPGQESATGQAFWRRRQAASYHGPGEAILGQCVSAGRDLEGHGPVAGFRKGSSYGCNISARVCHALATGNAVGAVEGGSDDGVGVVSGVGLAAQGEAPWDGRRRGHGGSVVQGSRGLLNFLNE